ncbi:hypothetical protein ABPG77_004812 [Micractinium sp. CCAP 211/92]
MTRETLIVKGKVKVLEWNYAETGPRQGMIFAKIHEFRPQNAPAELLGQPSVSTCADVCCASEAPAVHVPALTTLQAGLLLMLAGALLAWLYSLLSLWRPSQPPTPAAADNPAAPIVVADLARRPQPASPGRPVCSNSSFVTKVEAFLRFGGVREYPKMVAYPDASPKAQLPFIERGGQRIGDSHFILKHLVSSGTISAEVEFPPGARARTTALAVARMCDTDLAAAVVYYRFVDDEGWARCKHELLGAFRLPPGVGWLVGRVVRKQSLRRVVEQGFGRHSASDRLALVAHELSALSTLLGDRTFLFGRVPYAVDASAFGVLDQMAARELNPDLTDLLERHANLVAYRERIRARFFGRDYTAAVKWVDSPPAESSDDKKQAACRHAPARIQDVVRAKEE